jgi:hypothetical protein
LIVPIYYRQVQVIHLSKGVHWNPREVIKDKKSNYKNTRVKHRGKRMGKLIYHSCYEAVVSRNSEKNDLKGKMIYCLGDEMKNH